MLGNPQNSHYPMQYGLQTDPYSPHYRVACPVLYTSTLPLEIASMVTNGLQTTAPAKHGKILAHGVSLRVTSSLQYIHLRFFTIL